MTKKTDNTRLPLLFENFLHLLQHQKFTIGIHHRIRLHQILNRLAPDTKPNDLKFILCPLFATTPNQQQKFYRLFDSHFQHLSGLSLEKKKETESFQKDLYDKSTTPPKWKYFLQGVLVIFLIAIVSYQLKKTDYTVINPDPASTSPQNSNNQTGTNPQNSTGSQGTTNTPDTPGNKVDNQNQAQDDPYNKKETPQEVTDYLARQKLLQFRWIAILLPLLIWGLLELYRFRRRQLIIQKQKTKKPPYTWPLDVKAPDSLLKREHDFITASRLLRRRIQSDISQLDINATISKTIEKGGLFDIQYRNLTAPPEYFLLIDLPTFRNHDSGLWKTIADALEKEGLFVTRYFFENDPRICFQESSGPREYLADIKHKYSGHRLIIISDGDSLLDPISGQMDDWANLFHSWHQRALLTTIPPKNWGYREIALAKDFIVLPATLEGLKALKEHFDTQEKSDLRAWKQKDSQNQILSIDYENFEAEDTEALKKHLGEDTFQWLCACAVYPELHWNLTLHLGSLPCMPDNLLTETNILKLICLPWFKQGSIPDEIRAILINNLDKEKTTFIREAITKILEKNPPPKDSFAFDFYHLNLALQKWMLNRQSRRRKKELRQILETTAPAIANQDFLLLHFLESPKTSPLNFILPNRLRKIFYQKGVQYLGLKSAVRFAIALIFTLSSFFLSQSIPQSGPQYYQNYKGFWEADYGDGIIMIYIPSGEFTMGLYKGADPENRRNKVYLDGYWIGKTEVTVGQYMKFVNETETHYPAWREPGSEYNIETGTNDFYKKMGEALTGDNYPIVSISWTDTVAYCDWLSEQKGMKIVLPTEAQWEKASRGTDGRTYPWGNGKVTGQLANISPNEVDDGYRYTSPVGSFPSGSSPFGALDMSGNVWEWCEDWYSSDYYKYSPYKNPVGPNRGEFRVLRGGSWVFVSDFCRCAFRDFGLPVFRNNGVGFRLARSL